MRMRIIIQAVTCHYFSCGAMGMARIAGIVCWLALLVFTDVAQGAPSPPRYVEKYIEQAVDHFNYELHDTFSERYFLSSKLPASKCS